MNDQEELDFRGSVEIEGEEAAYLIQERPTGSFYRVLRLPNTVDSSKIQCNYDNGVLTIMMPKAEEKKKKQIRVKVNGSSKASEGKKKE